MKSNFSFLANFRPRSRTLSCCLLLSLLLVSLSSTSEFGSGAEAFVAEATEIISVVRIGVSLVEYIYKTFSHIFEDSGASKVDWTGIAIAIFLI